MNIIPQSACQGFSKCQILKNISYIDHLWIQNYIWMRAIRKKLYLV